MSDHAYEVERLSQRPINFSIGANYAWYLERFRLRTGIGYLIARVRQLCERPHLAHHTQLLVDVTSRPMMTFS